MTVHEKPSSSLHPEALSLPARYYTDPANHQSELERFFLGMWIHAGRADQIPSSGDYVLRDVAGESLIVTRPTAEQSTRFTTSAAIAAPGSARPPRAA